MRGIAIRAGFSERTVMRSVSELETLGFLAVIRNIGQSNKYILLLNNLSTGNDTESPESVTHTHDTKSPTRDRNDKNQCQSVTLIPKNPQESLRTRGSEFSKGEIQANSQAYEIYQPEQTRQADKKIVGQEMKHIKALLSGAAHHAK